jgi:hypothetical protein
VEHCRFTGDVEVILSFVRYVGSSKLPREEGAARGALSGCSEPPYFTRIAISRALLFSMELTQPRSPVSRHSLACKLGAAALFLVPSVGPYAGSCCSMLRVFGADGCFNIRGCKGVPPCCEGYLEELPSNS